MKTLTLRWPWRRVLSGLALLGLAALLFAFALGAFGGERVQAGRTAAQSGPAVPRSTARAERSAREVFEPAVGSLRSRHEVTITAQVGGTVRSVEVEAGQTVTAGLVALRLDDRDLAAQRAQAQQGLAAAEASVTRAQEGKSAGAARLEQARAAHERVQGFLRAGAATPEQDEAARATFLEARAAVAGAEAAIAAALAQREQARAALTSAEVALEHATLTVPIDGVVAERAVQAGDLAWPGRTLLRVLDPNALRLEARVREGLIAGLRPGQELEVELPALELRVRGRVSEVLPAADPRSRTFEVRVELDSVPGAWPGMYGRLQVPAGQRESVRAPARAVTRVGQLETVLVLTGERGKPGERVERRLVTTGLRFDDGTLEVLSGLAGGETLGLPEAE
jgi:RND family efflux transporter MFP subunit